MAGYRLNIGSYDCSDLVNSLKVGLLTIVDENAGRNAAGSMVFDIVAEKVKVYAGFRSMTDSEMQTLLAACKQYVNTITYFDPETGTGGTITAYHSDIEPDMLWDNTNGTRYKDLEINFIEM